MLLYRSRHHGCASVRREWFSTWSRTSRPHYSSKALWSSGQPGWRMWSLRCSSLTNTGPASPGQLDSSCSSGPSIGLQNKNGHTEIRLWVCSIVRDKTLANAFSCLHSSMVIRDLTLRSAASFGSFHLIRLLYDEYMFYLVEHRVAQATGETPIGVMGEVQLWLLIFIVFYSAMMSKCETTSVGSPQKHLTCEPLMAHLIMMFVSVFSSTASTPCPSLTLTKVCGKMYQMK